ncbi:polysaccharide pyruvyl transferase CsaB [Oscillatoria salina]|uniref:polysaccharide pyruvyl transferase CsaB n=1 Tax=Oscillatoria salina TaxID=331517 RepID=UPI0013BDDBB2|nr:polysaccharide pyruvyl transferase CsaB [Oscillatoria salina]MBZ8182804.1 polysaccharide pyruvyl transferase CsaB [Oscillatoria salina IIICB1]NET86968.1 polysaccharide pyruvyl transferase CsaB [Kamptonema sp. SIO1D9]
MGKTRAVICGYYGKGNGGDEALLVTLLQMLPESVQPLVLSGNPQETKKRYQVESCDRISAFTVTRAMRASEYFIWGGGSLMQDITSWASPIYYGGLMGLAQQMGLKTIAWAQGIGPLQHQFTRAIAKRALENCTAISVRDRLSAQILHQWQIPCLIAPDPVWALQTKPVKGLWDLPAPRIAVNLREHPSLTPHRLNHLTQALIELQRATQACILLVPFQATKDLKIAEKIAAQLPGSHQIISLEDPRELKGLFRGVEMTIGMRYHSLIMAAAAECRCFALSYDPKVSQLMAEISIPGYELEQLPDNPNEISKAWLEEYVNGEPLSSETIQSIRDRAEIHREVLIEAFLGD